MNSKQPLWQPASGEQSGLYAFRRAAEAVSGLDLSVYDNLWRWSVSSPEAFWSLVWKQLRGGES